jgi:predicted nucleic acid-binding protein
MILADSSVWIDYLGVGDPRLAVELGKGNIAMHPYVAGEIALGSFRERKKVLAELDKMPALRLARSADVRQLIESHALYSRGIGYVDTHPIASTLLTSGCQLWTRDKRLKGVAESMKIHVQFP